MSQSKQEQTNEAIKKLIRRLDDFRDAGGSAYAVATAISELADLKAKQSPPVEVNDDDAQMERRLRKARQVWVDKCEGKEEAALRSPPPAAEVDRWVRPEHCTCDPDKGGYTEKCPRHGSLVRPLRDAPQSPPAPQPACTCDDGYFADCPRHGDDGLAERMAGTLMQEVVDEASVWRQEDRPQTCKVMIPRSMVAKSAQALRAYHTQRTAQAVKHEDEFKRLAHQTLDSAGVPRFDTVPCRIRARLEWLLNELASARVLRDPPPVTEGDDEADYVWIRNTIREMQSDPLISDSAITRPLAHKALARGRAQSAAQIEHMRNRMRVLTQSITDQSNDEDRVRELARPILGDEEVTGDSYGTVGLVEIVEKLAAKHAQSADLLRQAVELLRDCRQFNWIPSWCGFATTIDTFLSRLPQPSDAKEQGT